MEFFELIIYSLIDLVDLMKSVVLLRAGTYFGARVSVPDDLTLFDTAVVITVISAVFGLFFHNKDDGDDNDSC